MTNRTPEEIARLTDEQRLLWIKTVLAITGTEPQRRAFIAGYNGEPLPRHFSRAMHDEHTTGLAVRSHLESHPK